MHNAHTGRWKVPAALLAMALIAGACSSTTEKKADGGDDGDGAEVTTTAAAPTTVATGPVKIGVFYVDSAGLAKSVDVDEAGFGDPRFAAKVLIDDLNTRGGLAGREVQAVYAALDLTATTAYAAQQQAACETFADDEKVFAVISAKGSGTGVMESCLAEKGVPFIARSLFTDGEQDLLFAPQMIELGRLATVYVERLAEQGFLEDGAKVGVVRADSEPAKAAVDDVLVPALEEHGVEVVDVAEVRLPNDQAAVANTATDLQDAAMRFATGRVTHVVFMLTTSPSLFMVAAENQGFHPKYAVTTYEEPVGMPVLAPATQLANAVGIGWTPAYDMPPPATDQYLNENGKRCLKLMQDAGQDTNAGGGGVQAVDLIACDNVWLLEAAFTANPGVTAESMAETVEGMADGYVVPGILSSSFGPGKHDGVSAVRDLGWDADCKCFDYVSDVIEVE